VPDVVEVVTEEEAGEEGNRYYEEGLNVVGGVEVAET
jgi:hypothetical protein